MISRRRVRRLRQAGTVRLHRNGRWVVILSERSEPKDPFSPEWIHVACASRNDNTCHSEPVRRLVWESVLSHKGDYGLPRRPCGPPRNDIAVLPHSVPRNPSVLRALFA